MTITLTYRPVDVWPQPLTPDEDRAQSRFEKGLLLERTIELLEREVTWVVHGTTNPSSYAEVVPVVIQLPLPAGAIRQDGQLRANAPVPDHPGCIVSFEGPDGPMRLACDHYVGQWWRGNDRDDWHHNLRAIAVTLENLRAVSRHGVGTGREQYRGFSALGAGTPMGATSEHVMTRDEAARFIAGAQPDGPGAPRWTGDQVLLFMDEPEHWQALYRNAVKRCHPDTGGSTTLAQKLQAAVRILKSEG